MDPYISASYIPPTLLAPALPSVVSISGWGFLTGVLIFIALLFLLLILLNVWFIYLPTRQLSVEITAAAADAREVICLLAQENNKQLSFCPPLPLNPPTAR